MEDLGWTMGWKKLLLALLSGLGLGSIALIIHSIQSLEDLGCKNGKCIRVNPWIETVLVQGCWSEISWFKYCWVCAFNHSDATKEKPWGVFFVQKNNGHLLQKYKVSLDFPNRLTSPYLKIFRRETLSNSLGLVNVAYSIFWIARWELWMSKMSSTMLSNWPYSLECIKKFFQNPGIVIILQHSC